jgi:DNA polymerase-3 subunit epsilon
VGDGLEIADLLASKPPLRYATNTRSYEGSATTRKVAAVKNPAVDKPAFVAIDFETANECKDSACAVGIAVVENGAVTRSFQRLIRPPTDYFSEWNFRTHGIHWQDVKKEDDFSTVWKDVRRTIGDASYFVAHNAGFDQQVLSECCEFYGIDPPGSEFLCTIEAASSIWTLDSYTLPRVCEFLRIPLKHHNAESDASASAHILLQAIGHGYDLAGTGSAGVATWAAKHLSDEIMAMVSSLMEDGQIEPSEIRSAARWMEKNSEAAAVWPGIELKRRLDAILRDQEISDEEITDFRDLCSALLGLRERKKTRRAGRKKAGVVAVCFTGFGPRKADLRAEAEAAGYHVAASVTKSLDYLVCGPSPGPSKLEQAAARGVKIYSLEEWRNGVAKGR